MEVCLACLCIG